MKRILLKLFRILFARLLSFLRLSLKINLASEYILLATSDCKPEDKLSFLLELDNRLYSMQSKAAVDYNNGIHTKHRHIKYHDFFIKHLLPDRSMLDIGCGNGCVDYDLVKNIERLKVTGIDIDQKNIAYACENFTHPNLTFLVGDALEDLPDQTFDVVLLSNVLEHIEHREEFLKKVISQIKPKKILIRVPLFERDWRVPLKEEIGVDYRLDPTHFIEYTREIFLEEISKAGLEITHMEVRWGEIWSVLKVLS